MFIVWVVAVPLVLFLVWAVFTDLKQRGRDTTGHSVDKAARRAKTESEAKGSEWGAGGA